MENSWKGMCAAITENDQDHSSQKANQSNKDFKNLPKYCKHYKFFLVEELALETDYSELHYGMCTVIGRIREHADGYYELENIRIPNFPKEQRLAEGTVTVCLIVSEFTGNKLQNGRYCEVSGEVKLLKVNSSNTESDVLTSQEIHLQLSSNLTSSEGENYLYNLHQTYRPAIDIDYLYEIDSADELIERNLEIRLLTQSTAHA